MGTNSLIFSGYADDKRRIVTAVFIIFRWKHTVVVVDDAVMTMNNKHKMKDICNVYLVVTVYSSASHDDDASVLAAEAANYADRLTTDDLRPSVDSTHQSTMYSINSTLLTA